MCSSPLCGEFVDDGLAAWLKSTENVGDTEMLGKQGGVDETRGTDDRRSLNALHDLCGCNIQSLISAAALTRLCLGNLCEVAWEDGLWVIPCCGDDGDGGDGNRLPASSKSMEKPVISGNSGSNVNVECLGDEWVGDLWVCTSGDSDGSVA